MLTKMIIGSLRHIHNGTTPSVQLFGYANFGGGITIRGTNEYQADIGWTNFLCWRWRVNWKEAQKWHYLRTNKKKSARLWIIAILKKLLMICWDMWQFQNKALHSSTGPTSIARHHSLNYLINKEKRIGTDGIDRSNYHLFSKQYTISKLQSSSILVKKLWLYEMSLAHKEYVEPDNTITCQAISMRNQMQSFLITNDPRIPIIPRERPVATQDNCISDDEQHAVAIGSLDHRQSVLESHPVWLLPTTFYNKPCSPFGNLL